MLKGSARLFNGTRFVADTASNAERANPAWTPSERVSTGARLQLRCLSWVIRVGLAGPGRLLVHPAERTFSGSAGMSQRCRFCCRSRDSILLTRISAGQAMMGRLKSEQTQLFYQFKLDDAVPEDHLVRKI